MRTHRPEAPHFLDSVPRAAAAAGLALIAALAAGCGDGPPEERTVASDRTPDRETARRELPPPTPDFRARTVEARPADADTGGAGSDTAGAVPAPVEGEVTYGRAESAYRSGDHERALRLFDAWLEREPGNPWGLYMLGLSARAAGQPERAEEAFRSVLEEDPDHAKSRVNLGRTLLDLGRPGAALEVLRPTLRGEEPPADAFRVAGNAAWEGGDRDRARRLYRAAIARDGSDAWAMNNLGLLLVRSGRHEEALGPLARALELRPELTVARNNLGVALERTGHPSLAAEHYRAAAEAGHPKAPVSLARVEERLPVSGDTGLDLVARAHDFAVEAEGWSPTLALEPAGSGDPDGSGPSEPSGPTGEPPGEPEDRDEADGGSTGGDGDGTGGEPDGRAAPDGARRR